MKSFRIFSKSSLILAILFSFWACESYLDKSPDKESLQDEDVFMKYENFRNYLDLAYTKLYTPYSGMYGNQGANDLPTSSLSDETFPSMLNGAGFNSYLSGDYQAIMELNAAPVYRGGDWTPAADFVLKWPLAWQGIAICNNAIEKISLLQDASESQVNELMGQAYFLRAYFYFEILIRWGGFEYLTQNMSLNEMRALKRTDTEEMVENIVLDCEIASQYLPDKWREAEVGRPPKGAAMALKSRLLLYAASPLFNPQKDSEKWRKAADAAWELISYAEAGNKYKLIDCSDAITIDVGYDSATGTFGEDLYRFEPDELRAYRSIHLYNALNDEVIFNQHRDNLLRWVDGARQVNQHTIFMVGRGANWYGWTNTSKGHGATGNVVDKYEMKNGYAIDDDESGYNPQNPYINRDPRFYANILFDNVECKGKSRKIFRSANTMSYTAGVTQYAKNPTVRIDEPSPINTQDIMNVTGYCVRKFWPKDWYSSEPEVFIQNVYFRLAEAYLNYAEAAFEGYGGASGKSPGASYSAIEALNKIRNRVGMPDVHSKYVADENLLRSRIRNERAVELCFENHRYWDLRRWKESGKIENRKIKVMNINWVGNSDAFPTGHRFEETYLKVNGQEHRLTFDDKHYWWPLRKSETELYTDFGQTPGW